MSLRVLALNAGSSSLKWSVVELPAGKALDSGNEEFAQGAAPELSAALARSQGVDAVAHRLVHGGSAFRQAVRIDEAVRVRLSELTAIDPLHAPRALAVLEAAQRAFPAVPHFACFDTAFHTTLPPEAFTYALPRAWNERFGLRRYGFHGLSVAHAVHRAPALARGPVARLVVCHLGSGCSLTAVEDGRSLDTTMGFTPLEGMPMATRSGSVDPGLLVHLLRDRGVSPAALDRGLERESGLAGLSGVGGDLRAVLAAAKAADAQAQLAYAVFIHGLRRALGQMLVSLDGLDALVFTGGIGEHSARVRRDALEGLGWLALALDPEKNGSARPDADISARESGPRVLVIEAREDLTMAREVAFALGA